MRCANGHENQAGTQFCTTCGLAVAAPTGPYATPGAQFPQPHPQPRNGFGITALVLGIVGLFSCWFGVIVGVLAIIFGALGVARCNRGEATNKTMALSGLILGIVTTVLYLLWFIVVAASSASSGY